MLCPECGTKFSNVLECRPTGRGSMIRRRRECFNGHKFMTYEAPEAIVGSIKNGTSDRNQQICDAVRSGRLLKDVAQEFGLAENTVSSIVRRGMPDYNARKAARQIQEPRRT